MRLKRAGGWGGGGRCLGRLTSILRVLFVFLDSSRKQILFLGSRLALQRGKRSIGSLFGERSHEEETVNILTGDDTVKEGVTDRFGEGARMGSVTFG